MLHPPMVPLVVVRVRALMFPAVMSEVFRETTSIREAEIVPEVICEASRCNAFTVSAESFPVKMPSLSI
ncbi:hypothetical protein [Butyricimonas faecalis]|uniref:hypothetical protein n=1 Tax=Butyricimonas faecalis TaxID=2093856 RepID=UPI001F0C690B|nr:hypothetical protein [Butyricimonas faecalis]